jgi:hypothetical protein
MSICVGVGGSLHYRRGAIQVNWLWALDPVECISGQLDDLTVGQEHSLFVMLFPFHCVALSSVSPRARIASLDRERLHYVLAVDLGALLCFLTASESPRSNSSIITTPCRGRSARSSK